MPKFLASPVESENASGRPGFGATIYVRPQGLPASAAGMNNGLGTLLGGIRDIRGPNPMTNPIVASHHRLRNGAVNVFPGLRDYGTIDFDCAYFPDQLTWQEQNDANVFIRSLYGSPTIQDEVFGSNNPMLDIAFVLPRVSKTIWFARGFLMSAGPYMMGQLEGIMQTTFSLKINGPAFSVTPIRVGAKQAQSVLSASTQLKTGGTGQPALPIGNYIYRVVIPDQFESFSRPIPRQTMLAADTDLTSVNLSEVNFGNEAMAEANGGIFRTAPGAETTVLVYRYPF